MTNEVKKKLQLLYLIDLVLFSIIAAFSEIVSETLQSAFFYVSLGNLILMIMLFRWRYKGIPLLVVWALIRSYFIQIIYDCTLIEAFVIALVFALSLIIIIPLGDVLKQMGRQVRFVVLGICGYLTQIILTAAVIFLLLDIKPVAAGHELLYKYNFSICICLLIGALFLAKGDLIRYVPQFMKEETKDDKE